jgi:hypothetical protein
MVTTKIEKSESDSDDDEEESPKKKMNIGGVAGLVCQFLPTIQEKFVNSQRDSL